MDPTKLIIAKKLTDLLRQEIGPEGCMFDMRSVPRQDDPNVIQHRVFRGRTDFGDSDPVPCISILEAPLDPRSQTEVASAGYNREMQINEWLFFIQGWIVDDKENPTDPAYRLAGAIEWQLGKVYATNSRGNATYPDIYMFGRLVSAIRVGQSVVRPPDDLSSYAYCYLPVVLTLAGDVSKPFQAPE